MADGAPDTAQQLLQLQSLINSSHQHGGSGAAPILLGLGDVNVGAGLSPQGKGLNHDARLQATRAARPGMLAKLLKDMGLTGGDFLDGMRKVAQAGAPREASISDISGRNGHGLGGIGLSGGHGGHEGPGQ